MPRSLHPDVLTALGQPVVRFIIYVRYEFDSGTIGLTNQLDDVVFDGFNYTGMGDLGDISELVENTAGDPSYFEANLSGVKSELLAAALNEKYTNRDCYVHIGLVDENGAVIGTPWLYFYGKITEMSCSYGANSSINVVASDELSDWERIKIERYTDQDQQARYPGDLGFSYVAQLSSKNLVWPSRQWFVSRA